MNSTMEKIEARAYELFLNRNGNGGSPTEDWLKAEKEITNSSGGPLGEKTNSNKKTSTSVERQTISKKRF